MSWAAELYRPYVETLYRVPVIHDRNQREHTPGHPESHGCGDGVAPFPCRKISNSHSLNGWSSTTAELDYHIFPSFWKVFTGQRIRAFPIQPWPRSGTRSYPSYILAATRDSCLQLNEDVLIDFLIERIENTNSMRPTEPARVIVSDRSFQAKAIGHGATGNINWFWHFANRYIAIHRWK